MPERLHLFAAGRVQGVFYRARTCDEARRLGLVGNARNLADSRVEVIAEGERGALEDLVAWCRRGPPLAVVRDLAVSWEPATGEFKSFDVSW